MLATLSRPSADSLRELSVTAVKNLNKIIVKHILLLAVMFTCIVQAGPGGVFTSFINFFFAISDTWTENPDFTRYLAELSSFGVDKLGRFLN